MGRVIPDDLEGSDHTVSGRPVRRPIYIVVMGVSGSGKSTVGAALASRLGVPFIEGDQLHPAQNVAKMSAGTPLNDEDRWPWLDSIANRLRMTGHGAVASCSALKKAYRNRLRDGVGPDLSFLYLQGNGNLLALRMASRKGHFMKPKMLESQLSTLEPPISEDDVLQLDGTLTVPAIVETMLTWVQGDARSPTQAP